MINETRLLWKARALLPALRDPTHERLAALVAEHGVDLATAALYLAVRDRHRAFVEEVEAVDPEPDALPRLGGELWIVPAAGWRERPEYGGDGRVLATVAEDLGMSARTLELESLGSIERNGLRLRALLAGAAPRSVLVASVSKGTAELKVALREPGRHREAFWGRLDIGGLPEGTPLLDYARGHGRTWWLLRAMMLLRRVDRGFLDGLAHRTPLLEGPLLHPADVPVASVVGFPLRSHLDGTIARRHGFLSPLGPNDGYGLVLDAMSGSVYPVWGASHYLRTPGLARVLYGVLIALHRRAHASGPSPG